MARIIIIDDEPLVRNLVRATLDFGEHELIEAHDGPAALARLYRRVRDDESRLARLEARLRELARISLDLVEASSAEAAGFKLAFELAGALPSDRVAVFVARAGKLRLLATHGEPPLKSSF